MAKPTAKAWPELKRDWDEYGHLIKFEDLFDMKVRSDYCYVVVAWKEGDDIYVADLATTGNAKDPWEFQNDSSDGLTMKQWKKLTIDAYCDSYTYPEDEE